MTEPEIDQLFGEVYATLPGRRLQALLEQRADAPSAFQLAEIKIRVARMRGRWETRGPISR